MTFDREITIAVGMNRRDIQWKNQKMKVSELYGRLKNTLRSQETLSQFLALKKNQQDNLKDIGGFVGGTLNSPHRRMECVIVHDLITLDFDNIPSWQTDAIIGSLDEMGCSYCAYSTRKHVPSAPRLRVVVPTDRPVSADEYEPIARRVAEKIGIGMADPTTFDNNRLMYWPSCCADSEAVYKAVDAPFLSADEILTTYADWHDFSTWPQVPGANNYQRMAQKQGEPTEKPGVVGLFCRTYDVFRAMEELIPGVYEETADPNRLTYAGGSTTGGAIV